MNKRRWGLIVIAIAMFSERGFAVYQVFFDTSRSLSPPFSHRIEGKYLTVDSVGKMNSSEPNPVFLAGLRKNDRVLETYNNRGEGIRISGLFDYGTALRSSHRYEPWILLVQRIGPPGSAEQDARTRSQELGIVLPPQSEPHADPDDQLLMIWIRFLLPALLLIGGLFMGFSRPNDDSAFLGSLLFFCIATILSADSALHTYPQGFREISLVLQVTQYSFAGYLFLLFFLRTPFRSPLEQKIPWLTKAALILSIAGFLFSLLLEFSKYISFEQFSRLNGMLAFTGPVFRKAALAMVFLGMISFFMNKLRQSTQDDQRRMTLLLVGVMSLGLIFAILAFNSFSESINDSWWSLIPAIVAGILFILCFVYAVVRRRVFGMMVFVRKGVRYLFASRGSYIIASAFIFTALYLTVGAATFHLEVSAIPGVGWRVGLMAALAFALAMTLPKINRILMPYIDRRFFGGAYHSQRILGDLSRAIQRQPIKPELLLELALSQINRALSVDRAAVFLRGAKIEDASEETDESQDFSISWIRRKAVDYQCCGIRTLSDSETQRMQSAAELQDLLLPPDSLIIKELQETISEPRVLEVNREDPDAWLCKLFSSPEGPEDSQSYEIRILKQLNTRVIVPMITSKQLLGFLSLGEKPSEEPYSKEEKDLLLSAAHQMAIAIDYSILSDRTAEQEKLKREIEIAKQVQGQLFPQRIPLMKSLDYIGICKAAREVGGDYYDFLEIGPGRLGFVVADISGKGISAALLMASLQALLRSHAHLHGDRAELLVWDINRLMHSSTTNGKYASLFYGFYDDLSRLLAYVNAGHLPPILYRKDGTVVRLRTGGMVVGMMADTAYKQEIVNLQPGDILLIFSDGITEAMNTRDQEFGEERLLNLLPSLADLPAASISEAILKSIADHVGMNPQHDDSTLVVIKAVQ